IFFHSPSVSCFLRFTGSIFFHSSSILCFLRFTGIIFFHSSSVLYFLRFAGSIFFHSSAVSCFLRFTGIIFFHSSSVLFFLRFMCIIFFHSSSISCFLRFAVVIFITTKQLYGNYLINIKQALSNQSSVLICLFSLHEFSDCISARLRVFIFTRRKNGSDAHLHRSRFTCTTSHPHLRWNFLFLPDQPYHSLGLAGLLQYLLTPR